MSARAFNLGEIAPLENDENKGSTFGIGLSPGYLALVTHWTLVLTAGLCMPSVDLARSSLS